MSDTHPAITDRGVDCTYLSKLNYFEQLFDQRTSAAAALFPPGSAARSEIGRYRTTLAGALAELRELYRAQYLDRDAAAGLQGVLTPLEANIAMATQQNLEIMRRMIGLQRSHRPDPLKSLELKALTLWMHRTGSSLERRDAVPFSLLVSVPQLLQAGRKPFGTVASLVTSTLRRRSVSAMTDALDASNFFRCADVRFEGVERAERELSHYQRVALIVIANHDLGIYDITLAHRLSELLGCQRHMIMNRRTVYPIAPPAESGDVIFVDEDDPTLRPVADSVTQLKSALDGNTRVSLAVYPEGMMPFTGAQMPLITKDGAFVIARKAAIALRDDDVPVVLVTARSNFLEHLTEPEAVDPVVSIVDLDVVPDTPLAREAVDDWIHDRRLRAENCFNVGRGEKMLNIFSTRPLRGSMTYQAVSLDCVAP